MGLYRNGGNLIKTLSWALGGKSSAQVQAEEYSHVLSNQDTSTQPFLRKHEERIGHEAAAILNNKIHQEVQKMSEKSPDLTRIDIDLLSREVDPLLWEFIALVTRPLRERMGKMESHPHVKKVRRYFILCQMLYCTNQKCNTPLHTLLADTIETCGGSRELIRIFNSLGAVSSVDTHDRFVTEEAENERQLSVWDHLDHSTFTVASTDNLDILQSCSSILWRSKP